MGDVAVVVLGPVDSLRFETKTITIHNGGANPLTAAVLEANPIRGAAPDAD